MKRVLASVLLLGLILCAAPAMAMDPTPELLGKWVGQVEMHRADKGFIARGPEVVSFEFLEQVGHSFHGVKTWTTPDGTFSETFSGVISEDGKHLYIAEHEDGLILGDIVSDTHLALYYLEHGDAPKAMFYELTRKE